ENIHDAGNLGKANHLVIGQIGDMRLADDRHHMVLAMRMERDVLYEDEIVIAADFLENRTEDFFRAFRIACEQFLISLCHTLRRSQNAFALRVVSSPKQKRAYRRYRIGLRRLAMQKSYIGLLVRQAGFVIFFED